jgi:dienelactone hydrolase
MNLSILTRALQFEGRTIASFVLIIAVFLISVQPATAQTKSSENVNPSFTPIVEIQKEDYAKARQKFRTKLVQQNPSPQTERMPDAPTGVMMVEFPSGNLRLKAWINRPDKTEKNKIPAVVFLHGGFGFGKEDWEMTEPFRNAGFIVLVPILRGENGQAGNFTLFYDEVEDVLAAADYLSKQTFVDAKNIFVAGHSVGGTLTMLAAQASNKFRAAASFSGSPDQILFVSEGFPKDKVPFDQSNPREFQMRSPLAYAASFKCPTRIYYGSQESHFSLTSQRTAEVGSKANLNVAAIETKGNHSTHVPSSIKQSISFFEKNVDTKSAQVLKRRVVPEPQPSLVGNTTFKLKGFENAETVTLAGTFNDWNPRKLLFGKENGQWVCRINLAPGKYFYKIVVDGEWVLDPKNSTSEDDGNGNKNSVLIVKP